MHVSRRVFQLQQQQQRLSVAELVPSCIREGKREREREREKEEEVHIFFPAPSLLLRLLLLLHRSFFSPLSMLQIPE